MSFKSVLDKIGADAKEVFSWLGTSKGQAVVATGEAVLEAEVPASTAFINLANNWLGEILKTQALASAAEQANGTGVQKAAAVVAAITPQALQFAQSQGVKLTSAQLTAANNALVAFGNAFANPSSSATPVAPAA